MRAPPGEERQLAGDAVSAGSGVVPMLELLYRTGCHLCDEMRDLLAELLPEGSYQLMERDIDEDPALRAAHDVRVPVLRLGGEELCHHFLDLEAVRTALASYHCELRDV